MSEASAHKLAYIVETTRGTVPTNPRFKSLPDTRTTLALTKESLPSERLTGSRFPAEPRTGASLVGGEIPVDLSSRTYDDFIASALQGEWVEADATNDSVTIEVDAVATTGAEVADTFVTTSGTVTVESIDAKGQEVVLTYVEGTDPPVTFEIFGLGSVTIDGEVFEVTAYTDTAEDATVKAGDTRKSFSVIREFSDFVGGTPFLLFSGCEVASWGLSASANSLVKSTFTFFGREMVGPSAAAPTGTTYTPAIDSEAFDTFSGVAKIDGVASCIITEFALNVNNGHAPKYAVGCATPQDASVGQSLIDGSITLYLEDATMLTKFVDETGLALEFEFADSAGNKMVISLPNLKIGSGTQADVTGDGPISIPVNFTAHKGQTLGSHISVRRVSPLAV